MVLGRALIAAGLLLVVAGVLVLILPKIPFLGRLPGDIVWRRGGVTVYLPLATCLLVSLLLTLLLSFFRR
jgi:hypothetical protein